MPMETPKILYEDNHLLVAVKPAGVLSQSDSTGDPDMLTLLKAYLVDKYRKPGEAYLGLLHRLDRPVQGVMAFAKTSKCASRISEQIRNRTVKKKYRAIVYGICGEKKGQIKSYLDKDSNTNLVTVYATKEEAPESAKESFLEYEVLGQGRISGVPVSLLVIDLHTGRSHQIRSQLASIGHPIVGDRKYGKGPNRFAGDILLESYHLELLHPVSKEKLVFELPLSSEEPWKQFGNHE
ncbi:MAG: RluA family pseudouridine synthase [Clostridiales bacterium]|nr:RluA family pseudouridine synthase [Clostridiales bacterium]